jgi:hypothetical protein
MHAGLMGEAADGPRIAPKHSRWRPSHVRVDAFGAVRQGR